MRKLSLACLSATLCTSAALAQVSPNTIHNNLAARTTPVAWVYVANMIGATGASEVHAYTAAANGRLMRISGSPFADDVTSLAVNGKYLFGGTTGGANINAYLVQNNGALTYSATTNILAPNNGCGNAGPFFMDHTGADLYNFDIFANGCSNNTYEAYKVDKPTGNLVFLNEAGDSENLNGYLSFIGNNQFAYGSTCYHFSPSINGFQRNADGSLTQLNINPPYPTAPAGQGYCPYLAAADPTNNLAIPMEPLDGYGSIVGPYQLATYTADSAGNLTTASTYANMPQVQVGGITHIDMAPSGKLLAVAGASGMQVFHFNGAAPVTPYTPLLATSEVDQVFWDNQNHLFAIGRAANKLWVFTVTPTGYSQAPGSPYAINTPESLIVQPLPRY